MSILFKLFFLYLFLAGNNKPPESYLNPPQVMINGRVRFDSALAIWCEQISSRLCLLAPLLTFPMALVASR